MSDDQLTPDAEQHFRFLSGFLGQIQDDLDAEFEASLSDDEDDD